MINFIKNTQSGIMPTGINILAGHTDMTETAKYTTRTTAGGEEILDGKLASVKKIQGDTVKSKNLIPLPYMYGTSYTSNGITYTVDKYGVITANGTSGTGANSVFMMEKNRVVFDGTKKLTVSGCVGGSDSTYRFAFQLYKGNTFLREFGKGDGAATIDLSTLDFDNHQFYILVRGGVTLNNVKFYPMVEYGDTASDFQPYYTDLKHAYFDSIKSIGKNLFDFEKYAQKIVSSGNGTFVEFDGRRCLKIEHKGGNSIQDTFIPNITHGYKMDCYFDGYASSVFGVYDSNDNAIYYHGVNATEVGKWISFERINPNKTFSHISAWSQNVGKPVYIDLDSVIFYGNKIIPYEPYKESIYKLPTPVELKKWDYIDVKGAKKYTQTKIYVFDGTEDWRSVGTWTSEKKCYYLQVTDNLDKQTNMSVVPELVCNYYDTVSPANCYGSQSYSIDTGASMQNGYQILIYDEKYSAGDVAVWKARLAELYASGKPLTISAKLETPTVEDLGEIPETYTAWNGGTETIEQGETDNSQYGAMPTITTEYKIAGVSLFTANAKKQGGV